MTRCFLFAALCTVIVQPANHCGEFWGVPLRRPFACLLRCCCCCCPDRLPMTSAPIVTVTGHSLTRRSTETHAI
uniref:Putative secreted protein n=1 Tax=Anopheles darlingi TaxID=43151 RepID=A0A2M4D5J2_ANODA